MLKGPTKLFDFPCHYAKLVDGEPTSHCWHIRRGFCESSYTCPSLSVYRRALVDHKCARLLRVLERRWFDHMLDWVAYGAEDNACIFEALDLLRKRIKSSLARAGQVGLDKPIQAKEVYRDIKRL